MDLKKLLCGVAVASMTVAGCGSSDSKTADAGPQNDATTQGDTGMTITGICPEGTSPTGGQSKTYIVATLESGTLSEDNKIAGFNLDDSTRGVCDPEGVDDPNGTPPDNFTGVDNTFGANLVSVLSGFLPNAGPGLRDLFLSSINDGTILILLQVNGIDDFQNDPCISISGYLGKVPGGGLPETTGGTLTPGQTFDIDPSSIVNGAPLISFSAARIVNGRVEVSPSDFPLSIPVGGANLNVTVRNTRLRFNIAEESMSAGVLGGSLKIDDLVAAWDALQEENMRRAEMDMMTLNLPAISADSLSATLTSFADLDPSQAGGPPCEAISVGFVLSGVNATANQPD